MKHIISKETKRLGTKAFSRRSLFSAVAILFVILLSVSSCSPYNYAPSPLYVHGRTHYKDMEYKRIDAEALLSDMEEFCRLVNDKAPYSEQKKLFLQIDAAISDYYTMYSLIEIKFYSDPLNQEIADEYNYLDAYSAQIADKTYEMLDLIALCENKKSFESDIFGRDYFSDWVPLDYPDEVVALMKQESELVNEYLIEISNPTVTLPSGKTLNLNEVDYSTMTENEIYQIAEAYQNKFAGMYLEVVKLRLEMARIMGVSYAEIAYDELGRDFSPEEVEGYLKDIATYIIPLYYELSYDAADIEEAFVDPLSTFTMLKVAADNMGGTVSEAFNYMFKYGLYDMGYSEKKAQISFQTYLNKYNCPFLFVSPYCSYYDLTVFSHEFGHFVDAYYNCNIGITVDNTEIASQAMELILPFYVNDMYKKGDYDYLKASLQEILYGYLSSGFIGLFEQKVYDIESPDSLTVDLLFELAFESADEMGLDEETGGMLASYWFETQHLFIAPMYTVGYAVSCDVSLQVLEAELLNPGKGGVDAYINVITRDLEKDFITDITDSGFASPFEANRLKYTAELIRNAFDGKIKPTESESETAG